MNGLEAIELMKQGKVIKYNNLLYRFEQDEVQVTSDLFQHNWKRSLSFDLNSTDYEEYIEPKRSLGWHNRGDGDFYIVHGDGEIEIDASHFEEEYGDEDRFSTEDKAKEMQFKQRLFRKLQRFSDKNGGNEIDWNDNDQIKFCVTYDSRRKKVVTKIGVVRQFGQVYFRSFGASQDAIRMFHDDLIKYFTHDWSEGNE